jgi:hypothetical protein
MLRHPIPSDSRPASSDRVSTTWRVNLQRKCSNSSSLLPSSRHLVRFCQRAPSCVFSGLRPGSQTSPTQTSPSSMHASSRYLANYSNRSSRARAQGACRSVSVQICVSMHICSAKTYIPIWSDICDGPYIRSRREHKLVKNYPLRLRIQATRWMQRHNLPQQ